MAAHALPAQPLHLSVDATVAVLRKHGILGAPGTGRAALIHWITRRGLPARQPADRSVSPQKMRGQPGFWQ